MINKFASKYVKIILEINKEVRQNLTNLLRPGKLDDNDLYIKSHQESYIRTIRDIDNLLYEENPNKNILEIGSFFGIVSIGLKKLGYNIHALDIPEIYQSSALKSLYKKYKIPFIGINLKENKLPYKSKYYDAVIICEVIEHLNFNPLPVFQEINRVLKKGGYIYLAMPNQAHFMNRLRLLFGRSIHNPINDYFNQFVKNNKSVDIHWREYTLKETTILVEKMGFEIVKKYYFLEDMNRTNNILKNIIKKLVFIIPSFRPFQVVIGKKIFLPK